MSTSLVPLALVAALPLFPPLQSEDASGPRVGPSDLAAFLASEAFRGRCLTDETLPPTQARAAGSQADCTASSTTIRAGYDPVDFLEIPVVFHVLRDTNGNGNVPMSRIDEQIQVLNEDFLALGGTNGGNGTNGLIHFALAVFDPAGNPTTGVTYSDDDSWYADQGPYYDSLAWDTTRYLNVYTNTASGALGYVPGLPQNGIVGSKADRVVVHWATVGSPAPFGPPFHLGRTLTHELGHYFGLYHTFNGGCQGGSCYAVGDLVCDTNPESTPTSGCPTGRTSCGGQVSPIDNYMDYSDDVCMERFTSEQINRMRCSILNWRPGLPLPRGSVAVRNGSGLNPLYASEQRRAIVGTDWRVTVDIQTPGALASFLFFGLGGPTQGAFLPAGEVLVRPPILRQTAQGSHVVPLPADLSLVGVTFATQAATWAPQDLRFTNALDVTVGF